MSGYNLEDLTITNAKIKNLSAEKITTGYLSSDRIEAGSIGASKIKTNELIVGTNIAMGPNATISWSNVTNQPNIGNEALTPWKNSGYATYITGNGVYTGEIYANQIHGGVAYLADGVYIGNQQDPYNKSLVFGDEASIYTKPSTLGPSIVFEASEVDLPTITCRSLHVNGDVTGIDYAPSNHSHGNSYIKSTWGQNISLTTEDGSLYVRKDGVILGSIDLS